MKNNLILGCLLPLAFLLNYILTLDIWRSAISHLPGCFCPWTVFQNIRFNMVPSDPFMSHLATQLGILQGSFRLWNWLSLRRLVSWVNHLPPVWLSTFWKSTIKQQLGCRFDILACKSSSFSYFDICNCICLNMIFRLYSLHSVIYFIKYSCTYGFNRGSLHTFYYILITLKKKFPLAFFNFIIWKKCHFEILNLICCLICHHRPPLDTNESQIMGQLHAKVSYEYLNYQGGLSCRK